MAIYRHAFSIEKQYAKDYLLSIGAIPTHEKKKFLCILMLQEWDKKTKQYQKVLFILYAGK
ncbi:hypothetical protein H3T61_00680 [Gilliamella sp. B14384H2]|uniref:hypothetical protein n=1 Tax=unclassified Gilliamella TaxID=2685620 RepID=UPI0018DCAF24|nr:MULTISPECIES: hypothetical protein [unclassified Gilliamella]MBI0036751.1 hypothetical protein [Gilliamella sp. B14384G10]MBI0040637.1 hypothetical protein [Gilliamella sp. B14384G7]MBI0050746.1 hypothetical protein [Gilliamella sp. B14384G13]MBI0053038.1 hypothetical protein [Gilliamella sp. B14384H2]